MSDDRSRDRNDDDLGLLRGFTADNDESEVQLPEPPNAGAEPLDAAAVAAHKAAKRERVRKRREAESGEDGGGKGGGRGKKGSALPALRPDLKPDTPALRAERVEAIRRDLVRRRRRKGGSMLFKLWLFVVLPTCLVAWFLWYKATDMYQSESSFMVETAVAASPASGGGALGGLLGGGSGLGIRESVAVQNFIMSRDVLRRLDQDHGIIAHYRSDEIDLVNRDRGATFEEAYTHYQRMVKVSYDPTEGLLEMSVIATSPERAREFSSALIRYAEEMVNKLQDPIQAASLADAEANLVAAEKKLEEAQLAAANLRKQLSTFSVEGEVSAEMGIISGLEAEREGLKTRLAELRKSLKEGDTRVQRVIARIDTLTEQIEARRQKIAGKPRPNSRSLADINSELEKANFRVQSAMTMFAAAIESREAARKEAARQNRYLTIVEQPSMPDRANYPKKWETTALAFLCFLGFYIIGSLTIALIREQASI